MRHVVLSLLALPVLVACGGAPRGDAAAHRASAAAAPVGSRAHPAWTRNAVIYAVSCPSPGDRHTI
jgi:hypothetical protein